MSYLSFMNYLGITVHVISRICVSVSDKLDSKYTIDKTKAASVMEGEYEGVSENAQLAITLWDHVLWVENFKGQVTRSLSDCHCSQSSLIFTMRNHSYPQISIPLCN